MIVQSNPTIFSGACFSLIFVLALFVGVVGVAASNLRALNTFSMFYTRLKKERRHTEPILTFQLQPQTYIHYNYLRSVIEVEVVREQNTKINP
jgi:hypothetical protein